MACRRYERKKHERCEFTAFEATTLVRHRQCRPVITKKNATCRKNSEHSDRRTTANVRYSSVFGKCQAGPSGGRGRSPLDARLKKKEGCYFSEERVADYRRSFRWLCVAIRCVRLLAELCVLASIFLARGLLEFHFLHATTTQKFN